jgi:hypothetical protein
MDKEKLESRLKQLEQEKIAAVYSYDGAIQDCKFWIQELDKKASENVEANPQ